METKVEKLMSMINEKTNTESILKIFKESEIKEGSKIIKFVKKIVEEKKEESNKLLSFIEANEFELKDCINILSKFKNIPIYRRIGELFSEEKLIPVPDYKYEIEKLEKEIKELEKNKTKFTPVTEKPSDFEPDILEASKEGKLTSIQYLIEIEHKDVETKDKEYEATPLLWASDKGHLGIIKYLIEECHCNIEAKDKDGWTPLHIASYNNHLDVDKYLVQ